MIKQTYTKDPDATLDYPVDWESWLDDDTISASEWVLEDGLTIGTGDIAPSFTGTVATAFIAGGTVGTTYLVTNRITTAGGRIDDRSFRLKIKEL
jgi:hypothetical protein